MPNPSLTELVVVLDRSGSMSTIKNDMIGGYRQFMQEQAAVPGECVVSLYMFDNEYQTVFEETPVRGAGELPLSPRGATALLDAMGTTILRAGLRFSRKTEDKRPGKVVFLVITDGMENASKEFTREQIRQMVEEQQAKHAWQFVYMAANVDAFATGAAMGVRGQSSRGYEANAQGVARAYKAASSAIGKYRSAGPSGQSVGVVFDDDDSKP